MTTSLKIGFIGLGVMGYPMAAHLANAGHQVQVFNRTTTKAQRWVSEHGGSYAKTPAACAQDKQLIITCVGNDHDVRDLLLGTHGALANASHGACIIDHTTASPELATELHNICASQSLHFIDAPVSGGQEGAEHGQLSIMCGATPEAFERYLPVLNLYAKTCQRMGDPGAGQQAKIMNQICIAGLLQGLSEALQYGVKAGLDCEKVISVIEHGAAGSWQMSKRHKTMLAGEFDHGFAVDWMRKDLQIALHSAQQVGATLPVTALVDQFYADIQAAGGGRWDTSSLISRLLSGNTNQENANTKNTGNKNQ